MLDLLVSKFRKESLRSLLVRLHRDEQGAEGLEKLLLIAVFVLPLAGVLMWFKDDLVEWVKDFWGRRRSENEEY